MHLEHFTQPRHNTTSTITLTPAGDIWVDSSPPPEVPAFTFKVDLTPSSPRCGTPSLLWETLNEPPTSKWSTNYTQRTVVESLSKHPPPPQGFGVNLSWLHMFISESIKEVQVSSVPNENMIKNQVISYKHPSSTAIMERVGGGSNQVRKHVQLWKWWGKHTHKLAQKKIKKSVTLLASSPNIYLIKPCRTRSVWGLFDCEPDTHWTGSDSLLHDSPQTWTLKSRWSPCGKAKAVVFPQVLQWNPDVLKIDVFRGRTPPSI